MKSPEEKMAQKKKVAKNHKNTCDQGKKCQHKTKYDAEAEYNQRYLPKDDYLLGDKICPQGIELFDILHCLIIQWKKKGGGHDLEGLWKAFPTLALIDYWLNF